tara:strand:+ start:1498 stop:1809 length:312 start_codon:yes stop_codon:yes gene_type:complete
MSSSDYLDKLVRKKYHEGLVKARSKKYKSQVAAEDKGEDTYYLQTKAEKTYEKEMKPLDKKYDSDMRLIRKHGKGAAKARGFGTNYNAKPYANPPRKPKANLK